jgi:hypothetical protein
MIHWRFLLILATAVTALALAPIPTKHVARIVTKLAIRSGAVVVVGPSAVDHRSKCDADQRTIAEMLADELGQAVRDASDGGEMPEESANLAAMAVKLPGVEQVVILVDTDHLTAEFQVQHRDAALFRTLNSAMYDGAPGSYLDIVAAYGGKPETDQPFVYKDMEVAANAALVGWYFPRESSVMPCPENDGSNPGWVEALNHQYEVVPDFDPASVRIFAALADAVKRSGRSALLVLLPVDVELLAQFDPDWPKLADRRVAAARQALSGIGMPLLDLSYALPKKDFADRWCACSHMLQSGRQAVAAAITAKLRALRSDR